MANRARQGEKREGELCRSGSGGLRVDSLESLTLGEGNNWGGRGYCQVLGAAVALDIFGDLVLPI